MIRSRQKNHTSLYFCIFILFLTSMRLWIGWSGREKYIDVAVGIIMLTIVIVNGIRLNLSRRNVVSVAVLSVANLYINLSYNDEIGKIFPLSFVLPISIIIFLNDTDRARCINYILKWFAILMVPSIITYLMVQFGGGLPSLGKWLTSNDPALPPLYVNRVNYFFYNYTDFYNIRFNGPFVEPGHLGMMASFLLYATGYDFRKKSTWVTLAAILFTLSLSGYVLSFMGYIFLKFQRGEIKLRFVLLFFLFVIVVYAGGIFYNGGNNLLNEKIFSRLELDEDRGFVGNNRVFGQIDLYFAAMFSDAKLLLYGYGKDTVEWLRINGSRGTGFVMWTVMHGIIGDIMAIVFYVTYFLFCKHKKTALMMLLFVIMMFWQRSYSFWASWIICFVYGITNDEFRYKQSHSVK